MLEACVVILFEDAWHETRQIFLPKFGHVMIAKVALRDLLLDDDCEYVTDEAEAIDEQIFYFVENNEFAMNNKLLAQLMLLQLK